MANSLSTLRTKAATYLNRTESDLIVNGVDLILEAANSALLQAQRVLDFEYLRTQVQVTVNMTTGGSLASAVVFGGGASVSVNKIERAYVTQSSGQVRPIELVSRETMNKRLGRNWDNQVPLSDWARANGQNVLTLPGDCPVLVREADMLYLWPNDSALYGSTNVTVGMDVLKWSDPFATNQLLAVTYTGTTGPIATAAAVSFTNVGTFGGYPIYQRGTTTLSAQYIWYEATTACWRMNAAPGVVTGTYWSAVTTGVAALTTTTWDDNGFTMNGTVSLASAPYTTVTDTNFFITYCYDWLLWAILRELWYFIKDEKRSSEIHSLAAETWSGVASWNESIGDAEEQDVTLD